MRFMLLLGLALLIPTAVSAQSTARLSPHPSPLFEGRRGSEPAIRPNPIPETHWKEGGIAGGVVVGLIGAGLGAALCQMDESGRSCTASTIGGFFVGGTLGFAVGALIGGQFSK